MAVTELTAGGRIFPMSPSARPRHEIITVETSSYASQSCKLTQECGDSMTGGRPNISRTCFLGRWHRCNASVSSLCLRAIWYIEEVGDLPGVDYKGSSRLWFLGNEMRLYFGQHRYSLLLLIEIRMRNAVAMESDR